MISVMMILEAPKYFANETQKIPIGPAPKIKTESFLRGICSHALCATPKASNNAAKFDLQQRKMKDKEIIHCFFFFFDFYGKFVFNL